MIASSAISCRAFQSRSYARQLFPKRLPRASAGFTLIEVLVALVIVALALTSGVHACAALVVRSERAESVTLAKWCVTNAFAELTLSRSIPEIGDRAIVCDQIGRRLFGEIRVRPTENPLFRRVELSFDDGHGNVALRMVTLASVQ